jgi:hypothetical protein
MNSSVLILMTNDAGEGSRGGVVIGRTSSGKAIYKNKSHSNHNDFNSKEHEQASRLHSQHASKFRRVGAEGRAGHHDDQAEQHRQAMTRANRPKDLEEFRGKNATFSGHLNSEMNKIRGEK